MSKNNIPTKRSLKSKVKKDMENLGIYKPEYDNMIEIYVDLNIQYQRALKDFNEGGQQYETETAAGGTKKSAIVATLESLRKDILAYSDRLCLNPKAIETVTIQKNNGSKLANVLSGLSG